MLLSIITINYNNAQGLKRTINSVENQSWQEFEWIVIDGGSTDGPRELIESISDKLSFWCSEPDNGIYDAMNKGIQLAEGDIIGILNSNDWYEPDTVETVVKEFAQENCDLLFANIRMHKRDGSSFVKKARIRSFQTSRDWNHPTMFVRADVYKSHPFRNKGIHDDYGCYLQIAKEGYRMITLDKVLANFRMGGVSNHKSLKEAVQRIKDRYRWCYRVNGYSRWYLLECIAIEAAKMLLG